MTGKNDKQAKSEISKINFTLESPGILLQLTKFRASKMEHITRHGIYFLKFQNTNSPAGPMFLI